MTEQEFRKHLTKTGATKMTEWQNEGKETFIVYKYEAMAAYLVSGDEFDWELGWMLQKGDCDEALQIFQFAGKEKGHLRNMWNMAFQEEQELFASAHKQRKFTPVEVTDATKAKEFNDKG